MSFGLFGLFLCKLFSLCISSHYIFKCVFVVVTCVLGICVFFFNVF